MNRFLETWKGVIINPSSFFKNVSDNDSLGYPVMFALINFFVFSIGNTVGYAILDKLGIMQVVFIGSLKINIIISAITGPIIALFFLLIVGIILFILFKIVGGSGSLEGTVKIISYSSAVNSLAWIPVVGWLFWYYKIYLNTIGGKLYHNISILKSAIVVIVVSIPFIWVNLLFFLIVFANFGIEPLN